MPYSLALLTAAASAALPPLPLPLEEVFLHVTSATMEPTLPADSIAVAEPLSRAPSRGDVVVARGLNQPSARYALRVVGLPEERIEFDDGFPVINGQKIKNLTPWIPPSQIGWAKFPAWNTAYVVPPNSYYLLADNHKEPAFDSLVFGGVPAVFVLGTLASWETVKRTPGRVRAALSRVVSRVTAQLPLAVGDGYTLIDAQASDTEISVTYRIPSARAAELRQQDRTAWREALCQNQAFRRATGLSIRYSFEVRSEQGLQFHIKQSECVRPG